MYFYKSKSISSFSKLRVKAQMPFKHTMLEGYFVMIIKGTGQKHSVQRRLKKKERNIWTLVLKAGWHDVHETVSLSIQT